MRTMPKFHYLTLVHVLVAGIAFPIHADDGKDSIIPIETRIQSVCMYPDDAWITRSGTMSLSLKGRHRFRLSHLPSGLTFSDLRISVRGPVGSRLGEIALQAYDLDQGESPEVKRLKTLKDEFLRQNSTLDDRENVVKQAQELVEVVKANQVQTLQRMLTTETVKPNMIQDFSNKIEARTLELARQRLELKSASADGEAELTRLNECLQRLSKEASNNLTSIQSEVDIPHPCDVEITLSYRTALASWYPVYEARLSEDRSKLEWMISAAAVQNTGENWSRVKLEFSPGRQEQNLKFPSVPGLPGLSFREERERNTTLRPSEILISSGIFARLRMQGDVDVYPGKEQCFRLATMNLKPSFRYLAIPRMTPDVFLVAQVNPSAEFPLVPGSPVQLMQGNERLGTLSLEVPSPGESLRLCFGPVPGLQARFQLMQKGHGETGGKTSQREWSRMERLWVESTLPTTVEVDLQDRTISASTDSVKTVQMSEPPSNPSSTRPGQQSWTLRLEGGSRAEVLLKTHIQGPLVGRLTDTGDLFLEENP